MRDNVTEELIGAYLDGELTSDEREFVERQLAESAEVQQLLDELQGIRSGIRSLPRFQLPPDFHQRVVSQIEAETPEPASLSRTRESTARPFAWQTVALAGISLVAIFVIALSVNMRAPQPTGGGPLAAEVDVERVYENAVAWANTWQPQEIAIGPVKEQFLLVYDITLTPDARRNKLLEKELAKAGIVLAPAAKLDETVADGLVALTEDNGVEKAVPYPQAPGSPKSDDTDSVELIYVTAQMRQFDKLWFSFKDLEKDTKLVSRVWMSLIKEPREVTVLEQVHKDVGFEYAQTGGNVSRAYRLTLNIKLRSSAPGVATIPGLNLQGLVSEGTEASSETPATLDLSSFQQQPAKKRPEPSATPADEGQGDQEDDQAVRQDPMANVLVIVRNLNKAPAAAQKPAKAK